MVNRYLDTAVFYDAGKVGPRTSDLDLQGLQHDFGFGFRFHSLDAHRPSRRRGQKPRGDAARGRGLHVF